MMARTESPVRGLILLAVLGWALVISASNCLAQMPAPSKPVKASPQPSPAPASPLTEEPWALAPSDQPQEDEPILFRRVYAAADRMDQWPLGKTRYLPIDVREFERLVELAAVGATGAPDADIARLLETTWSARLVGDELVDGTAEFKIDYRGQEPSILSLEPCSPALSEAKWVKPAVEPAVLGLGPNGKLGLLALQSGTVQLAWTARAARDTAGGVCFQLELPPAQSRRLILELPDDLTPQITGGVVSRVGGNDAAGTRRWQLDLGGPAALELRLVSSMARSQQLTLVRQTSRYDFSPRGVELVSQFSLDVHHGPLREISFSMDPSLRLVSVRSDATEVPWTTSSNSDTGRIDVVLQLPEALQGSSVLRLSAVAPLVTNRLWRLPDLRAQGMFWVEANATLLVPVPLSLEQLSLTSGRQTKSEPLPAPGLGDLVELQYFSPDSSAEVMLVRQEKGVELRQGVTVDVGATELAGRTLADFRSGGQQRFAIEASVLPGWMIDSVESIPAGAVSDWILEPLDDGGYRLSMLLTKPLTAKRSVRLAINGRSRQSALAKSVAVEHCRMLKFSDTEPVDPVIALHAVPPYRLELSDEDKLVRLHPDKLDPTDFELLRDPWSGFLLTLNGTARSLQLGLRRENPRYSATILVEAGLQNELLTETYILRCQPETARVERLLVHFSQARPETLRWSSEQIPDSQFVARRLEIPGQVNEGETWEITLRRPLSTPFELRASRTVAFRQKQAISLAALPGATATLGTLVFSAGGDEKFTVDNRRLTPIPAGPGATDLYPLVRATYRYEPLRDALAAGEAAITVAPDLGDQPQALAWVWSARLASRYAADGTCAHMAMYQLQNSGLRRMRLRLPAEATLRAVWVDDVRLPLVSELGFGEPLEIELPARRKFPVVVVHFETQNAPLGLLRTIRPSLPEIEDLAVVTQQWTLWLPPGYRSFGSQSLSDGPRLSWQQRLFGPLGGSGLAQPFNPLQSADWSGLVERPATDTESLQVALPLLERMGAVLEKNSEDCTWGRLLQEVNSAPSHSLAVGNRPLAIDRRALARLGINPGRTIRVPEHGTALQRAVAMLQQFDLALMVHRRAVVLTSAMTTALYQPQLVQAGEGPVHCVLPGVLADALEARLELPESGPLASATDWIGGAIEPTPPWAAAWDTMVHAGAWSARSWQNIGLESHQVRVVRADAISTLGLTIFLLSAALSCWLLKGNPPATLTALGSSAALALLVPEAIAPLATGCFLGVLASVLVALLRVSGQPDNQPLSANLDSERTRTLVMGGLVLLVWLVGPTELTTRAAAAPPAIAGEKPAREIHKVFVPVDARQRPVGDKVHVPEALYLELLNRAAEAVHRPGDWMLSQAIYRGALARHSMPATLYVAQLRAIYQVRVFSPQARVRIPLAHDQVVLLDQRCRLDGRPIEAQWEPDGQAVVVTIEEPGDYQLSLALEPRLPPKPKAGGFKMRIPRLPLSRLDLTVPGDAPAIDVAGAQGAIVHDYPQGKLTAELGAIDTLSLGWPLDEESGARQAEFEVEEMLWLEVQPGAVVLTARLRVKVLSGRVRVLRLHADSRLRLLPFGEDSPVAEVRTEDQAGHTFALTLKRNYDDQVVIDARLLLAGTSGVGNLRVPHLSLAGARATKRLMAVSVDPALKFEESHKSGLRSLAVPDFMADWGESVAKPHFAYRLTQPDFSWSLSTRPGQLQIEAEQSLSLGISQTRLQARLLAKAETTSGYTFQHRILAPPELIVDAVTVRDAETQLAARWSRDAKGNITVFLTGPVAGPHEVCVEGTLPPPDQERFTLPKLQLETTVPGRQELIVYRQPDVLVDVQADEPLTPVDEGIAPQSTDAKLGRLVGRYVFPQKLPRISLVVLPNTPELSGGLVTLLNTTGEDQWSLEIDYRVDVQRGRVDTLRFAVPRSWSGPYEVLTGDAETSLVEIPGEKGLQLVVRPRSAILTSYRLRIRGPLQLPPGQRLRVPEIVPLHTPKLQRYLVLPTQSELEQLTWQTSGLKTDALPALWKLPLFSPEAFEVYRIVGERFEAVPKLVVHAAKSPKVRLADIRTRWNMNGSCHGVATFDLDPAGLDACDLRLPPGYRLVQAVVEGQPAVLAQTSEQSWTTRLALERLPQRLEVVFTGDLAGAAGSREVKLEAPALFLGDKPIEVKQTLWTVYAPLSAGPAIQSPGKSISAIEQELLRLRNIASILDRKLDYIEDLGAELTAHWSHPWTERLLTVRAAALAAARTIDTAKQSEPELKQIEETVRPYAIVGPTNSGKGATDSELPDDWNSGNSPLLASDLAQAWLTSLNGVTQPVRSVSEGASSEVAIRYAASPGGEDFPWRVLVAGVIGLVTVCLVRLTPGTGWSELGWRWPHACGVAAGLFWWLWLTPSLVGLVIVGVSLAAMLWPGWKHSTFTPLSFYAEPRSVDKE